MEIYNYQKLCDELNHVCKRYVYNFYKIKTAKDSNRYIKKKNFFFLNIVTRMVNHNK